MVKRWATDLSAYAGQDTTGLAEDCTRAVLPQLAP